MYRRISAIGRVAVATSFALAIGIPRHEAAAADSPGGLPIQSASLAAAMPPGAVGFAEGAELGRLVQRIQTSSYLEQVQSSPQFQAFARTPQYVKAQAVRQIVETQLGMDLWKLSQELLRDRLAIALYPGDAANPAGQPAANSLLVLRGIDPKILAQIRQRVEPFLTLADEQPESSDAAGGARIYSVGGKAFVAVGDSWVAAATLRELLTKSIALLNGTGQGSLADDPVFQQMAQQMGAAHLLSAFVNTGLLTKARGSRLTPEKLDNPVGSMLLGGIFELAAGSPFAGLTLDVEENRFVLTSALAGDSRKLDEAHRVFFSDPAGQGTREVPSLPGVIGGFTFYLDLANWYRQRERLLEPQVLPGFDQFETGIGNLLPGKDVGEDVIPLIGRTITFVAAPQDFTHLDGKPGLKLPGFGVIIDLARPEEGGDLFQLFFQTLAAVLNLEARQQNREPWVMHSETFQDVQISYGRYLKKPAGDNLPIVFNFMPASARVGDKFIVATSLGLCRQLIDSLHRPPSGMPRSNRNLNLEFHLPAVADALEANKDVFQARDIQQGKDAQQAGQDFSAVVRLLRQFDVLRLSTSVKPEAFQIQLEGSWK